MFILSQGLCLGLGVNKSFKLSPNYFDSSFSIWFRLTFSFPFPVDGLPWSLSLISYSCLGPLRSRGHGPSTQTFTSNALCLHPVSYILCFLFLMFIPFMFVFVFVFFNCLSCIVQCPGK